MKIRLRLNDKDNEKAIAKYNVSTDWKLLSYCLTTAYNWIKPNRSKSTTNIYVKIREDDSLAGWYNYSNTLYININNNETYEEFVKTIFHEFCHWKQYMIDNRPSNSMVAKRPNKWDCEDAELEAENWELIGIKALEIYNCLSYSKNIANEYHSRPNEGEQ
jgi:hypothetical protein